MKKVFNLRMAAAMLAAGVMLTSCSDDDDPADPSVRTCLIDFENTSVELAGPDSYGANLYYGYDGTQFTKGAIEVEPGVDFEFGLNSGVYSTYTDLFNGGMFLSQWNYRTDKAGTTAGWWENYTNQCSVYNTASTDGANKGAGADGSNTFAVINGYGQTAASFGFSAGAEYEVSSMMICPTSYNYGMLANGNPMGNDGGKSIKEAKGWFKVLAYGYDAQGNAVNGGKPLEKYICDYRTPASTVELFSTWQTWDLSALGKVNKIKIDFDGSDTGQWGLNTPAYICIDNIKLVLDENK